MNRVTLIIGCALSFASACGIGDAQPRLRTAVDAKQAEMDRCYTTALAADQSIEGQVEATLHVEGSTGHVEQVEFGEGQVTDPQLRACLTNVLQGVTLADAPRKKLEVKYTFQLVATGG
jgi:hypothetical protein